MVWIILGVNQDASDGLKQSILLLLVSFSSLLYIITIRPNRSPKANMVEAFNELCIYLVSVLHVAMQYEQERAMRNRQAKSTLAWMDVSIILFSIGVSIVLASLTSAVGIKKKCSGYLEKREVKAAYEFRIQNREYLVSVFGVDELPNLHAAL